jgi:hypothetical protein
VALTRGDLIDDFLAAWLRAHGGGADLEKLTDVCPIDGDSGCEAAARTREAATSPGWLDGLSIDVNRTGAVTTTPGQHVVMVLREMGVDWREYATVQLPNYPNPVPYGRCGRAVARTPVCRRCPAL